MELESDAYDVVVIGTGIAQSIAAASLANAGNSVLHLDPNEYYGGDEASLTLDEITAWAQARSKPRDTDDEAGPSISPYLRSQRRQYSKISHTDIPPELLEKKRQYALSLFPAVLPSRGALISTLIDSGVSKYVGFRLLDSVNIWDSSSGQTNVGADDGLSHGEVSQASEPGTKGKGKARRVPGSKEEVFKDATISLVEKRRLMKFLMFVAGDFEGSDLLKGHEDLPLPELLSQAFSLPPHLAEQITFGIAHCSSPAERSLPALRRTQRYLKSIGRYGSSAFLVGQFGGAGEIAQGFCRACAVKGGTYVLGDQANIQGMRIVEHDGAGRVELTLACHPRPLTATRIMTTAQHLPADLQPRNMDQVETTSAHVIAILRGLPDMLRQQKAGDETSDDPEAPGSDQDTAIIVFPPENGHGLVRGLIMGEGTGSCPLGQYVLYLECEAGKVSDPVALLEPYLKRLSEAPLFIIHYLTTTSTSKDVPSANEAATHDSKSPIVLLDTRSEGAQLTEGLDWQAEQGEKAFWIVMGGKNSLQPDQRGWWEKDQEDEEEPDTSDLL